MAVQGLFQPTLPVWGETGGGNVHPRDFNISTHSPRVGRDPKSSSARRSVYWFQPTLPVWGETQCRAWVQIYAGISTHSPRVGRDLWGCASISTNAISTHSPRVGRDIGWQRHIGSMDYFNPLSPCGERLQVHHPVPRFWFISTHSPRVGRDGMNVITLSIASGISTHSPRVGRDGNKITVTANHWEISTHSPRVGRDNGNEEHKPNR